MISLEPPLLSAPLPDVILSAAKDLLFLRTRRKLRANIRPSDATANLLHLHMASSSRVHYIGVTNNLERRVTQHKDETIKGFAARYRCHRLVWYERYSWIGQAIAREKELKGWLRARKIALIQQDNPTWIDLSEEWGRKIICSETE